MVTQWLRTAFAPKERCGPLCQSVQNEVASIARAEALARLAEKHRIRNRGTRKY